MNLNEIGINMKVEEIETKREGVRIFRVTMDAHVSPLTGGTFEALARSADLPKIGDPINKAENAPKMTRKELKQDDDPFVAIVTCFYGHYQTREGPDGFTSYPPTGKMGA